MRPHVVIAVSLSAVLAAAAARPAADSRAVEVRRIRAHFDSVLAELPARDLSALTAEQRSRRAALVATLRAYRDRGAFPHNYDFPGRQVPYFVDRGTGVLCAVAHLLASSGRRDIVDRVARTDNNVWVPALAGDTAFTSWLAASGLTLDEAARIQVPYESSVTGTTMAVAASSLAGTALAVTASAVNAGTNGSGAGRARNVFGVAAGAVALGAGAAALTVDGVPPVLGAASVATGVLSAFIATRGITRHRAAVAREREGALARRAAVTPLLPIGRERGAGIAVVATF
jgi:hypothetical protein